MTSTLDDPHLKSPKPCPPGTFCLGGVAHNTTLDWIPNNEKGQFAPQPCTEGFYCPEASGSPTGSVAYIGSGQYRMDYTLTKAG
eukprot:469792-Ditylum_brightwellii.AAC.1